ncbi:Hyaluronidase [Eumeta japonica]|uniref:Hyaluronidase n=1 Tax=Eumeta variegata TaxID=151549 RepID=A0A4C1SQC6_EUMVA|nr:Hyaluronidase [Eumeta japonica]
MNGPTIWSGSQATVGHGWTRNLHHRNLGGSYYVIQVQEDEVPSGTRLGKPFKVYWNVPTMQCASKKIPFEDLHQKYGIIQNEDDRFRGEKISILYDPGIFPALLENETSGNLIYRNGGVPQEGNLERHLVAFAEFMEQSVLKDFSENNDCIPGLLPDIENLLLLGQKFVLKLNTRFCC